MRISTLDGLTVGDYVKSPYPGELAYVSDIEGDYQVRLRIIGHTFDGSDYCPIIFSGLALDMDNPKNFGHFVRCIVCGGRDPDFCMCHEFQSSEDAV